MKTCLRTIAAALMMVWLGLPTASVAQDAVWTPEQKEAIEQIVRDYLLANPDVVYAALQELQRRQRAADQERQRQLVAERLDELHNNPDDPFIGNPDGAVTVVEFFDYKCPYCKSVVGHMGRLVADNDDVRIVLKEFPILGPDSTYAARASLAARGHENHFDFHVALMEARGELNEEVVRAVAEEVGIDFEQLKVDMDDPEIETIIQRNIELAKSLGINGTPTFIIGDRVYSGALNFETMQTLIRTARSEG